MILTYTERDIQLYENGGWWSTSWPLDGALNFEKPLKIENLKETIEHNHGQLDGRPVLHS